MVRLSPAIVKPDSFVCRGGVKQEVSPVLALVFVCLGEFGGKEEVGGCEDSAEDWGEREERADNDECESDGR